MMIVLALKTGVFFIAWPGLAHAADCGERQRSAPGSSGGSQGVTERSAWDIMAIYILGIWWVYVMGSKLVGIFYGQCLLDI